MSSELVVNTSFKEKFFTHINSQQMWMNFNNTFSSSFCVDCAIQINFNLAVADKGWKLLYCKRRQSE